MGEPEKIEGLGFPRDVDAVCPRRKSTELNQPRPERYSFATGEVRRSIGVVVLKRVATRRMRGAHRAESGQCFLPLGNGCRRAKWR